ncbi:hypothetical protein Q7C36_009165 [Tachysurus vachellii]|uniref:DUF4806 domain-containing protein n=1 Tax=Tachysurus vachellii TaxID=175792 RepID=A0AA88SY43_TACVA|nr:hypothetical protein Q7C36_009165 [Tachysurus vachellii]
MFHIVSFLETNEVEVVPSGWVDGVWPHLRGESLTTAVKLAMKPKKEWKIFKVKLLYTTDNYDDARKKLPEAELFSDIQSDTESGVKKPRRIIDDDDDNEGQNLKGLEPPPRIKPPAFQTFRQSTQSPSTARQQPPLCQTSSQPPAILLREILTKQEMILDQQNTIMRILQSTHRPRPDVHDGAKFRDHTMWRVLKATFTTAVARGMNWRGVNGKIGVQRLVITEVVIGAVRQNPLSAKASNKDIETNIIKWLHLAGDREGGRRERMKKREAQQNTVDPH